MMRNISKLILVILVAQSSLVWAQDSTSTIYDFELNSLEGEPVPFSQFKGKKMLLVNVASKCGFTPQYEPLQELHDKFGDKVTIIGVPANNFGKQEPGTHEEIQEFCQKNYGVSFLMLEKISVKGDDQHPLYQWLSNKDKNGSNDKSPSWNFCKYLIDEQGKVIEFYPSMVSPMSEKITSKL